MTLWQLDPEGTVTSPQGFLAGAVYAGIKTAGEGVRDLGILYSEVPCVAAGVFTQSKARSAPVAVSEQVVARGRAHVIVVNSGCANAYTGERGLADAIRMAGLAADKLGLTAVDVLVASTGVTGVLLPMDKIGAGINHVVLREDGGHEFLRAMMTTDTVPKEVAVTLEIGGATVTIGGIAKGAGMIHPNMATMLSFIATDAAVEADFLRRALRRAVDVSFNMITVDGDTSPSDTVVVMANGLAGNRPLGLRSRGGRAFRDALTEVCTHLAKAIARDGEGATKFVEVIVEGARSRRDARSIARTVVGSSLVKTAIHGEDPNWGRILAAAARAGADLVEQSVELWLGSVKLMEGGQPLAFDISAAEEALSGRDVSIRLALGLGRGEATAWGCDLSEEYVTFNSAYTT